MDGEAYRGKKSSRAAVFGDNVGDKGDEEQAVLGQLSDGHEQTQDTDDDEQEGREQQGAGVQQGEAVYAWAGLGSGASRLCSHCMKASIIQQ